MTKEELTVKWKKVLDVLSTDSFSTIKVDTWLRPLTPEKIDEKEGIIWVSYDSTNSVSFTIAKGNFSTFQAAFVQEFNREFELRSIESESTIDPDEITEGDGDSEIWNIRYSFENFVSGPNNRLALAVSLAVADGYNKDYNPLFLYGGSGLGKTHLLHSIGQSFQKKYPQKKVCYTSSEAFVNEFVKSVQEKTMNEFRNKYRNLDMFLLDDVQFIAGKEGTEEELFNTFDELSSKQKQIIFTSDKPPKDLGDMPDRLKTRFSQGMVVDIQPPDYETRSAILIQKINQKGYPMNENMMEVVDLIAQSIPNNIRELEGALNRVLAQSTLLGETPSKALVRIVLTEVFDAKEKEITPNLIKKEVANHFGIKISDIESSKRSRDIAFPRQIAIYLMRKFTTLSTNKIGEEFGGRDHTTVMHSYEKIEEDLKRDENLKKLIHNLEKHINS